MLLNKERKILIAVLGAGVSALMADRLFILEDAGPSEAQASSAPEKRSAPQIQPPARPPAQRPASPANLASPAPRPILHVARKLTELNLHPAGQRDITRRPQTLKTPAATPPPAGPQRLGLTAFEAMGYTVQAMLRHQNKPVWMVNGQLLRQGDVLDGYTILRIGEQHIEIQALR